MNEKTKTVRDAENSTNSSTGLMRRLEKLYDAGGVRRMHTIPTVRTHTIAEHVYGSMLIAVELFKLNVKVVAAEGLSLSWERVMQALLVHDAPEVDTGDIPAPVKRASFAIEHALEVMEAEFYQEYAVDTRLLNSLEADIVKAADILDLVFNCVRERLMGNRHPRLGVVYDNAQRYAAEKVHLKGVVEMKMYLAKVWGSV